MICYVDEEKLSFNRKLREGAGGKSSGSSGSKGRDSKSSSKPKPSTSNNHKASRDSSNDANSMRKEQQSIRKYNNNNNNKNNNKASRDSSNDANFMRKEQQSVREYNKEYNNNLKYDSAINANSMRKEQQAEREFNKAYNNSLKYDSTINTDTMKQEQLVIRKINNYLNRNNASDANLMKQEQLMIKKIDAYNGRLKANADGLNGASYSIKNSVTGLNEAITIIDKIKNVSGNNLSQQETNLAMQLASLEALLIEANAGTKNIDKIVNNIMDMYTRFEKQQSGKKEIILNEYGKPDLKNWTAEAVLDYAEKEVNNYFTGLHNKQIKENLKNSKTIGEAIGYMGDIAGSTISNALYNISKGVAKSFENVDDALHSAYLLLKDGNKTWTNEKLKDAGKEVKKSRFEETIHNILFSPTKFKDPKMEKLGTKDWNDWSIEENIKDIIGDKTTNWFNTNFKLNEKDQNGITRLEKFEKNSLLTESSLGGQVMQNFGQMVPNIVLGNVFGAAASLGTLYAKSFGSSAESAYNMGATIDDASTYAALSAGVEVFTEKMFGIVGGIVPKGSGWLDNVITYASKTGELLGGAVGEVFEEHLSNLAQPIIKSVTINRDSSIREMMKEDFLDAFKDTTLVTLGTTALCNLLGYSMGAIKAKIEYSNVLEYSNNIPEGSKSLINEIIKYDDTSTTSQPEKIQSNQSNQQNPKINNNTPLLTKSFNINDIISFFIKKPLQLNPSKNNIQNQSNIVEEINRNINQKGSYILPVKSTIDLSVDMLNQVNDLSKLQVQILSGFADFNGKLKSQYNNSLYIDRITYTGYEALSILTRIEELSSRVDMKLPTMERARQIYELIANEYSYFEQYEEYQNGHKIVASLRGITNNNSIGREGLVCAGYATLFKEMCTRAGILCDYITGESDGVRHAWNVVVDGNKIIPVDVTWKTAGGKEWFGSSEEFQRTHKAFSKEIFKKYDDSSFYSNYIESQKWSINQQIKQESPNQQIKQESPNQQIDIIANQVLDKMQIMEELHKQNPAYYSSAMEVLDAYLRTGNIDYITRNGGCRTFFESMTIDQIAKVLNYIGNKGSENVGLNKNQIYPNQSKNQQNKQESPNQQIKQESPNQQIKQESPNQQIDIIANQVLDKMQIMEELHKQNPAYYSSAMEVLDAYLRTGNIDYITRNGGCRTFFESMTIDQIAKVLNYIGNKGSENVGLNKNQIYPNQSKNQQNKQESPNQQIDIIVNQNNSNVIYSSASDVVHNIKDQITIPDNLKIIEKALNSSDDYYEQLVCCHTKQPKTIPSIESVNKFYNKFKDSSRYWWVDQGNNFSHIGTPGANGPNILSKLFLNIANYTDALNFCIMFADKCNESNIPFYFKTIKANNGKVEPFQLARDESIVIYSSDQYLANYVNIINEIKNKTNIQFEEPPILAGVIDGYIGFGQDRHIPHTSYNQNRSKLLNDAVKFANEKLSKMYPSRSITSILNEIRNNPSTYKTYLDDITMYIKENAIYLEINPEKLFLNSYNKY